jgi:hypothetical protein
MAIIFNETQLVFKDPNVANHLSVLHDKYVIVSADKAPNNIVCVCKSHYVDCLIKKLDIDPIEYMLIFWKEVSWSI